MKKYVLDINLEIAAHAGSKARIDIIRILQKEGFELLNLTGHGRIALTKLILFIKCLFQIKFTCSEILIQYPINQKLLTPFVIKWFFSKKTILLIHDVFALRSKSSQAEINKEISFFNLSTCVISHNRKMTLWLKDNGCTCEIIELDIFDYLIDDFHLNTSKERIDKVAFAGNLSIDKSGFIYLKEMPENVLNVYGLNYNENIDSKVCYKGVFRPEELPKVMNEKFGLIWDGESLDKCSGDIGNYLKYNNPHKTSLYLAAELPVIVWKKAAIATFVVDHNIGVAINSLDEIGDVIRMSEDDYSKLLTNTKRISTKIKSGFFTRKALYDCLKNKLK